jgi:hypothetical protein
MAADPFKDVRERPEVRRMRHVLVNCECRHEQTGFEALKELDALLAENERLREALELVRDGRCSCGYFFKWGGAEQIRCENCGTHVGYGVPAYTRKIAEAALAAPSTATWTCLHCGREWPQGTTCMDCAAAPSREALAELHAVHCGCSHPGSMDTCEADVYAELAAPSTETWTCLLCNRELPQGTTCMNCVAAPSTETE